jgi:ABC-type antimicrobial peptide transport system permease subunit
MFAVALGALSVAALGRGLVFRARLRRHDLVVLRALGLRSRDVLGVVLGEALVVVAVAATLGLTAGCLIGASIWRLVAEQFGIANATKLPLVQLALAVSTTLTIALGVVAVSVARTSSAFIGTQLRVE